MTFVHEMGHVVCGWSCGGTLRQADLRPWALPYSVFEPDPYPLVTLWGGPILGAAIPLLLAAIVRQSWMRLIAAFCVLSNGVYLALAWYSGEAFLDTTKLLEHGAHPASIAGYCLVTIPYGYIAFRREFLSFLGRATPESSSI